MLVVFTFFATFAVRDVTTKLEIASGNGTNCENIINHFAHSSQARVTLVVCNKAQAPVVERARRLGVTAAIVPRQALNDPATMLELLSRHHVELIVLAGFLLMVPAFLIQAYPHAIINIHPALLPRHGGKGMYGPHVHEAVWKARDKETGMTVHWVTEQCDGGDIIAQYRVALSPADTPETIAQKEHELEMKYFPQVIERVIASLQRQQA